MHVCIKAHATPTPSNARRETGGATLKVLLFLLCLHLARLVRVKDHDEIYDGFSCVHL